jgi:hypothetical protein
MTTGPDRTRDDWRGERLIRSTPAKDCLEADATVRAQIRTLARLAGHGLSQSEAVRRTGLSMHRIRAISETFGISFTDGRKSRVIEGGA